MRNPDFICVGAPRSGTTWLYETLSEHPEIYMPGNKSVNYFNTHFDKGFDWYIKHFEDVREKVCGESSPLYLCEKDLFKNIKECLPEVKIILMVRDPLDRLESQIKLMNTLHETSFSIKEHVEKSPIILEYGMYHKRLTELKEYFDESQFHIVNYNNLMESPGETYKEVLSFLGADESFIPKKIGTKVGYNIKPKSKFIERLRVNAYRFLSKNNGGKIIRFIKSTGMSDKLRKMNKAEEVKKSESRPEKFNYISHYQKDLEQFESHTGLKVASHSYE